MEATLTETKTFEYWVEVPEIPVEEVRVIIPADNDIEARANFRKFIAHVIKSGTEAALQNLFRRPEKKKTTQELQQKPKKKHEAKPKPAKPKKPFGRGRPKGTRIMTKKQKEVLDCLKVTNHVSDIARRLGISYHTCSDRLNYLVQKGLVNRKGRGMYRLVVQQEQPKIQPQRRNFESMVKPDSDAKYMAKLKVKEQPKKEKCAYCMTRDAEEGDLCEECHSNMAEYNERKDK